MTEELEPVGFGVATVHTEHEKELARKVGRVIINISRDSIDLIFKSFQVGANPLPHMVLLLDQRVIHYKEPTLSAVKAIEFIR